MEDTKGELLSATQEQIRSSQVRKIRLSMAYQLEADLYRKLSAAGKAESSLIPTSLHTDATLPSYQPTLFPVPNI